MLGNELRQPTNTLYSKYAVGSLHFYSNQTNTFLCLNGSPKGASHTSNLVVVYVDRHLEMCIAYTDSLRWKIWR